MLSRLLLLGGIGFGLLLIVGFEISFFTPLYGDICSKDYYTHQEDCAAYNLILVVPWKVGEIINMHGALIEALATLFIAGFTATLWFSTYRLWKSGERQHAITNRAFIFIVGFTIELSTGADKSRATTQSLPDRYLRCPGLYVTRFAVQPRWKNSGSTPTKNMSIQTNWQLPNIERKYTYANKPVPFFIGPQAIESSEFIEIPGTQELIDWSFNPSVKEPLIPFWGRADYYDVFGGKHFIEWCYRLRYEDHKGEGLRASFTQWGDYNRSDEDDRK